MKKFLVAAAMGALALAPLATSAGTLTSNMAVSGTVVAACTAFTAPSVAFGTTIAPLATDVHPATAPNISFTCATGVNVKIDLDGGLNAGATAAVCGTGITFCRQLHDTTNLLPYNIDTAAFGTFSAATEWGNPDDGATYSGISVSSVGTGAAKTVACYPYITTVPLATVAGAYTDTVVATLNF